MRRALILSAVLLPIAEAAAVPSPDTVAVLANARDRASMALAQRYLDARSIPRRQLCPLDLPAGDDIDLATYRRAVEVPFLECLERAGIAARIEAAVVVRGLPLRVWIPTSGGSDSVALTAALGLYHSATSTGAPLLGRPPGALGNCGVPCLAAAWPNPFRRGTFQAGWSATVGDITYRPLLVTMIHGRSEEEAAKLIASATTAEALGGAPGTFVFMDGADGARGALDIDYRAAIQGLAALGLNDAVEVPFDANATGRAMAAFFTGTAGIGQTIEGNRFLPGALVDNLTSFGAVPANFGDPSGEVQVSIARWVAMGVAGVHGTVDEPLNNCFPSRHLIVDYAAGGTLGEAFHRALPFVYWRNLVLGDPMAAPYKTRTSIAVSGLAEGDRVAGSRQVHVDTDDLGGRRVGDLWVYVDGVEVAHAAGGSLDACLPVPVQDNLQILIVSQVAAGRGPEYAHRNKSWLSLAVHGASGPSDCSAPDAGIADLGLPEGGEEDVASAQDATPEPLDAGALADAASTDAAAAADPAPKAGCACASSDVTSSLGSFMLILVALLWRGRR